ncbi:MAG: endolytic transglycosylase MltG [Candidatus Adiutrix sp.]|jgi:UPF0755 protein|nr:endolytic transglycosylase MltG [Candidatus Adiutrix sp.]
MSKKKIEQGTGLVQGDSPKGFILESEEPAGEKKIRTGPGCLSRLFGFFGIVLTVAGILAFLAGLKYSVLFLAPEEESREVVVSIPDGASAAKIGQLLEEAGVIKSADAFVWTLKAKSRLKKAPIVLKAGEMALDPSLPVWTTLDLIARGNYKLYPFTVPEGRNIYEIAQLVETAGFGSQADFLALCRDQDFIKSLGLSGESLEGYLFPETYSFSKGTPLKSIIRTMTEAFDQVWRKFESLAREKGLSKEEVVTLASIVEKETGVGRERPVIAGVFFNRLAKGMRLETDPTVIYGLFPDFNGNITRKDLQTPHPYNTYVIAGLPPGPISNPGEAAVSAVVKPDIVPYLFFVSRNDGTHDFSETYDEHRRKVNRYQRGQKSPSSKSGGRSKRP